MDYHETYEASGSKIGALGKLEDHLPGFLKNKIAAVTILALCAAAAVLVSWLNAPAELGTVDKSQCVIDDAEILSDSTTTYLENLNAELSASCYGAQIGVKTVQSTGRTDIADYAQQMFDEWGVGSSDRNNGVMLLLVPGDDNYYCATGSGLVNDLPNSTVSALLNQYLENAWVEGDYDAGVQQTCQAIAQEIARIYGVSLGGGYGQNLTPSADYEPDTELRYYDGYEAENRGVDYIMSMLIFVLVLVVLLVLIIRAFFGPRGGGYGGYGGGFFPVFFGRPRPPRPPRAPRPPREPGGPRGGMGGGFGGPRGGMGGGLSNPRGGFGGMGGGRSGGGVGRGFGGGRSGGGAGRSMGGGSRGGGVGRR